MTEHDLKEMKNLGAELGAAKAENEKLRGLLREAVHCCPDEQLRNEMKAALSQQAELMCETMQRPKAKCGCPDCGSSLIDWPTTEPTDTYTAVEMATAAAQGFRDGQAAVEQAPAQDERGQSHED